MKQNKWYGIVRVVDGFKLQRYHLTFDVSPSPLSNHRPNGGLGLFRRRADGGRRRGLDSDTVLRLAPRPGRPSDYCHGVCAALIRRIAHGSTRSLKTTRRGVPPWFTRIWTACNYTLTVEISSQGHVRRDRTREPSRRCRRVLALRGLDEMIPLVFGTRNIYLDMIDVKSSDENDDSPPEPVSSGRTSIGSPMFFAETHLSQPTGRSLSSLTL